MSCVTRCELLDGSWMLVSGVIRHCAVTCGSVSCRRWQQRTRRTFLAVRMTATHAHSTPGSTMATAHAGRGVALPPDSSSKRCCRAGCSLRRRGGSRWQRCSQKPPRHVRPLAHPRRCRRGARRCRRRRSSTTSSSMRRRRRRQARRHRRAAARIGPTLRVRCHLTPTYQTRAALRIRRTTTITSRRQPPPLAAAVPLRTLLARRTVAAHSVVLGRRTRPRAGSSCHRCLRSCRPPKLTASTPPSSAKCSRARFGRW